MHQFMQQIARPVIIVAAAIQNVFDLAAICKPHRSSRGINRQLVQQIPSKLTRICRQQGLQLVNVVKAAAIQQLSARIDGRRKRVREIVTGSINAAHSRAFLQTTILCSPTAEDVKVFEGKIYPSYAMPAIPGS